ncbi:MAG: hypothetical protein D6725_14505 [Planctomycetota bacterium]|nr:MAG: hypothetical protein D6725_14505 [Planctomycetota bacterium]
MLLGTVAGISVGAIPGLTGAMLIALTLPLTFKMHSGKDALVLLISMYVGSISGGLISATLLRMPGTPASIMTTFDGFPLARRAPGRALGLGVTASFVGGLVSWLFLVLLARPMADLSIRLGPFDYFALILMALVLIASVSGESLLLGLLSGVLGILASVPGTTPASGRPRWTFGLTELNDGFKLLPVLIGLFAVSQLLLDVRRPPQPVQRLAIDTRGMWLRWNDWKRHAGNMLRSSLLGTWVGILPGIGANIGSVVAYTVARRFSRHPEEFGRGSEEGVIASEAANNATVGGALIPLISLGIPGSVIDAVLLGALVIHDLQPGPLLFQNNPDVVYTVMAAMFVSNIAMFVIMMAAVRRLGRLLDVSPGFLLPTIGVFCVLGSYALANRVFDVWVMMGFGVLGVIMHGLKIPTAPFVIGFILAPLAEEKLYAGLQASSGSFLPLFTRPVAATFVVISAILFAAPFYRRGRAAFAGAPSTDGTSAESR